MKRLLTGTAVASLITCGVASADGLPRYARSASPAAQWSLCPSPSAVPGHVVNWTGCYLGIQGGNGRGHHERFIPSNLFANDYDSSGRLFGVHGGVNWQIAQFLIGVEADANWAHISGDDAGVGGTVDRTTTEMLSSLRGRLGFVPNGFGGHLLLFVTGGFAWANLSHQNGSGSPEINWAQLNGPTAGFGAEWALSSSFPGWSIGAEFRRYWLDTYAFAPTGLNAFEVENRIDTFTVRFTWHH